MPQRQPLRHYRQVSTEGRCAARYLPTRSPATRETLEGFSVADGRGNEPGTDLIIRQLHRRWRRNANCRATLQCRYSILRPSQSSSSLSPIESERIVPELGLIQPFSFIGEQYTSRIFSTRGDKDDAPPPLRYTGRPRINDPVSPSKAQAIQFISQERP